MSTIEQHIYHLIATHDCVVVPGWGAFIANHLTASLSDDGTVMSAPGRCVCFNGELIHDDGLLITAVARRECVSYDTAISMVANEVELMRRMLAEDGSVDMPLVGRFTRSGESVDFMPAADSSASMDYMGLPQLSLAPIASDDSDVHVLELETDDLSGRSSRRFTRVAASVAVILGLGLTLTTPVSIDNMHTDYASITLPAVTVPESSLDVLPTADADTARTLWCVIPRDHDASAQAVSAGKDRCYLIVASCATPKEAQRYVDRRPNQNLNILNSDGRYRIYAASAPSRAALDKLRATAEFQATHPASWIYER